MKHIRKICQVCLREIDISVTEDQYNELMSRRRRPIQEILPDVSPNIRELFITGMCGFCSDNFSDNAGMVE